MEILLLSGGSGKRLWPLSNDNRSKQFLEIINYNGKKESMVQRIYRQLNENFNDINITVATSISQKNIIEKQIGNEINIVCEPSRRNTFPAILLSAAFLYFEKKVDLNEIITILPIDTYVNKEYFKKLLEMKQKVNENKCNLCLMGIKPIYPSCNYGYILKNKNFFKEKPNENEAKQLIENGALWNGGIICTRLSYLINLLNKYIECNNYLDVLNNFEKLNKNSIEYEILEKENNFDIVEYEENWKDLGTWDTITTEIDDVIGKVIVNDSKNTNIINELSIPIISAGVDNSVIVATYDGILVLNKNKSSYLNEYTKLLKEKNKYEEREWGKYIILEESYNKLIKNIFITKGKTIPLHKHKYRDEIWTIISGKGKFILNDIEKEIKENDVLYISKNDKHSIIAYENIEIVEIQLGDKLFDNDYEYN